MKHPSSKFTVHLTPTFANEVEAAAEACGLPPAKYIEQAVEGFFASQRITRMEGGKEVKGAYPRRSTTPAQ
jgi:hypothetical protein